jgi:hypothetical protein
MNDAAANNESKRLALLIEKVCVDTRNGAALFAEGLNSGVLPTKF